MYFNSSLQYLIWKPLSSIYEIYSDQITQMKCFLQKSSMELAQEGKSVLILDKRLWNNFYVLSCRCVLCLD